MYIWFVACNLRADHDVDSLFPIINEYIYSRKFRKECFLLKNFEAKL